MNEVNFKNESALLIENSIYRTLVLPNLGGKIASFYHKPKEFELLFQHKGDIYQKPDLNSDFAAFDASGFDDCFPSIAKETFMYGNTAVACPDHGEIWCSAFSYEALSQSTVRLKMTSKLLPYRYYKTISLTKSGLELEYEIINDGNDDFHCFYTVHLLMNCYQDMHIFMPEDVNSVVNVVDSSYLGRYLTEHHYPITKDTQGNTYRLDRVFPRTAGKYEKYYAVNKIAKGICGAYFPKKDVRFTMKYDSDKLPYLGFWISEGGFRGDYNCALEPSSGFFDSIKTAKENKKLNTIKPGENFKFDMSLWLE